MRRLILSSTALLIAGLISTPGLAAQKKVVKNVRTFDECKQIAIQRGFTYSDLDASGGQRASVKRFMTQCMQGKQG